MTNWVKAVLLACFFVFDFVWAYQERIVLFPLDRYEQSTDYWVPSKLSNYGQRLLSEAQQNKHLDVFLSHYSGGFSPWSDALISESHKQFGADFWEKRLEEARDVYYGSNFRLYPLSHYDLILDNMNLSQISFSGFRAQQRAIATDHMAVRHLPSDDAYFLNPMTAGNGYPFDMFQVSTIWAGTPLYVLGESRDGAWSLVQSPSEIGWVKNDKLAFVDSKFVEAWRHAARASLGGIIRSGVPITSTGVHRFYTYVGSVFPVMNQNNETVEILIPIRMSNRQAQTEHVILDKASIAIMPLEATPKHFAKVIQTLQNRPYGWGGSYFYNDCSAELKNLFTPFAVWIPRHSSDQVAAGQLKDLSSDSVKDRLSYLAQYGREMLTLIHTKGHIMLYIGQNKAGQPITYQNIWALCPKNNDYRAVIGQSIFFPLLENYPEDAQLSSLAGGPIFRLSFIGDVTPAIAQCHGGCLIEK